MASVVGSLWRLCNLQKSMNAWVAVTSSSDEKLQKAADLGADYGLNYTKTDVTEEIRGRTDKRGVDVVVDCIGGESWAKSLATLVKGGRLVTCGATAGANPTNGHPSHLLESSQHLRVDVGQ